MTVSEQLRRIVLECDRTTYRIGTDAGINIRTIDRFVKEGKPATTDTFDALSEYFGLELAEKKTGTTVKRAAKKPVAKRKRQKKTGN